MAGTGALADWLAPELHAQSPLELGDGDRVAVVGGGPSGSFFAYFLLQLADSVGLDVGVDIYEPREFTHAGPGGCNHCGGIVSESLVQIMASEGITLPSSVIQRGIESYVVHMDVGSVRIESPRRERRIASLYRGNGPRGATPIAWSSFDGYLVQLAQKAGARVVRRMVTGLNRAEDGRLRLVHPDQRGEPYALVAMASGVNSGLVPLMGRNGDRKTPETTRTYIAEFDLGRRAIQRYLGDSMHVFLLDIDRLEFAALIPKGEYVTMVMLGDDIDDQLIDRFLTSPEVRRCLPTDSVPRVCNCAPVINVDGAPAPFDDRLVFIGDAGVTRLYKDGIGAAFRTSKAAAETAVLWGVSAEDFRTHYLPICQAIESDNRIGKFIFGVAEFFKAHQYARKGVYRMTAREQLRPGARRMSQVLWNLFTGSAPYREVFQSMLHPAFFISFGWNLVAGQRLGPGVGAAGNGNGSGP